MKESDPDTPEVASSLSPYSEQDGERMSSIYRMTEPSNDPMKASLGQTALTDRYPDRLDQGGVCNGLSIDYTRHAVKERDNGKKSDYIKKINIKLALPDPSSADNFVNRIQSYHTSLQENVIGLSPETIDLKKKTFTDNLPEKLKNSSVIGLTFYDEKGGHITAIQAVRNKDKEVTGYKIFDPNYGEYDCSSSDPATNFKNANNRIKNLSELYGFATSKVSDLEKTVKQYDLAKKKDKEFNYKYPDKNPNKKELESNRLTTVAGAGQLKQNKSFLDSIDRENIDNENKSGVTALQAATIRGDKEATDLLLERGADVNRAGTKDGWTPLDRAAFNGRKEIADSLIEKGADVNKANPKDGWTPLHHAAFNGHTEVADSLIKGGADINASTKYGLTPLHLAAHAGKKETTDLLLEKGANVNKRDTMDRTALDLARESNHPEISEKLQAAKAKQDKANQPKSWFSSWSKPKEQSAQSPQQSQPSKGWFSSWSKPKEQSAQNQQPSQPSKSWFSSWSKPKDTQPAQGQQPSQPSRNWFSSIKDKLWSKPKEQPVTTPVQQSTTQTKPVVQPTVQQPTAPAQTKQPITQAQTQQPVATQPTQSPIHQPTTQPPTQQPVAQTQTKQPDIQFPDVPTTNPAAVQAAKMREGFERRNSEPIPINKLPDARTPEQKAAASKVPERRPVGA